MKPLALLLALLVAAPAAAQGTPDYTRQTRVEMGSHPGLWGCRFDAVPGLTMGGFIPGDAYYVAETNPFAARDWANFSLGITRGQPATWRGLHAEANFRYNDERLRETAIGSVRLVIDGRPSDIALRVVHLVDDRKPGRFLGFLDADPAPADLPRLLDALAAATSLTLQLVTPAGKPVLQADIRIGNLAEVPAAIAATNWTCS